MDGTDSATARHEDEAKRNPNGSTAEKADKNGFEGKKDVVKLTDICNIQYGYAFDSKCFSDDASLIPLVRIRDVKRGYSETFYSGEYSEEYIVRKNDLLVGMDGEFNIARWKSNDSLLNQRVCRIIASAGIDEEYLRYALTRKLKALEDRTAFVTVKHLSAKEINAMELALPPISVQTEISGALSKIESIIEKKKSQIEELDTLIKARFLELFDDFTEMVPLSYYIASLNAGKSLAGEAECPNKVLKTGAVTYDYFDPSQIKNLPIDYEPQEDHRVNTGDVIISRMNTAELVGAAAYVWRAPERIYLPDRLWKAEIKETACPIFVWQMLIQSSTKKSIRRIASGTSGSMKNISKPAMLGIRVKKVPLELQEQFSAFVRQTDKSKSAI